MNIIWIAAAAFGGAIISALLGWLDSEEPFDARKFGASLVRAFIAAVSFAIGYSYVNYITPIDLGIAFLAGAGVDSVLHRASGTVRGIRR